MCRIKQKARWWLSGLFFFEKTGCLLPMLKIRKREAHRKSYLNGLISCCYFFATPTRLAAGLGTKDYPFIVYDDSPRFNKYMLNIGSPASFPMKRLRWSTFQHRNCSIDIALFQGFWRRKLQKSLPTLLERSDIRANKPLHPWQKHITTLEKRSVRTSYVIQNSLSNPSEAWW